MDYTKADAVIDWAEIYALDVQPLPAWQREFIKRMYGDRPASAHHSDE